MKGIKVYKDKEFGDYVVVIDDSVYIMNRPNHYQGINQYCGVAYEYDFSKFEELSIDELSADVKKAICNRIKGEETENERNERRN